MKTFIAKIFKKKKCEHNKNTWSRQYLSNDKTPMIEFWCFDCDYRDIGHVYTDADTWEIKTIEIKNGKIHNPYA